MPLSTIYYRYLILGALRGNLIIKELQDLNAPSRAIAFEGTLTAVEVLETENSTILITCIQTDSLNTAILEAYLIDNLASITKIGASFALPWDFITCNLVVPLSSSSILVIFETSGIIAEISAETISFKNRFTINTRPPSSYTEMKTFISSVSNVLSSEGTDSFFASTNKSEVLFFEHRSGQFIITPIICDSIKPACLHIDANDLLFAPGDCLNGAIFKFSRESKSVQTIQELENWAPIVDLDSTEKKTGQIVATCGNLAIQSSLCSVRRGIKNFLSLNSDPHFRGSSKLWTLKRYKSDPIKSFIAVAYPQSTAVFKIQENELEFMSEICGLEVSQTTLALADAETSSFWIQVCPDRVLVVKICEPDGLKTPTSTIWRPEKIQIIAATILRNLVILMDAHSRCLRVLNVVCQVAKGSAEITELGTISIGLSEVSTLSAIGLNFTDFNSEFILSAGATSGEVFLWKIQVSDGFFYELIKSINVFEPVNSVGIWKEASNYFLGVGRRTGYASFYKLASGELRLLLDHRIGDSPVQMFVFNHERHDQVMCCTSRGVWYISNKDGEILIPEKFHPHVDCIADLYSQNEGRKKSFVVTKKDSLAIVEAELIPSSWLHRMFSGENLKKCLFSDDGLSVVSCITSKDCSQNSLELLSLSALESTLRTTIPAHITAICRLTRSGSFAVATVDSNGQGSVHIFSSQAGANLKRRGSSPDLRKQASSFSFIAASSGFSSLITCICELRDGIIVVSCETDIYLLKVHYSDFSCSIFRSEPRRSPAYHMSSRKSVDGSIKLAIVDEDGLEIIMVDLESDTIFKHHRGGTRSFMGSKVHWLTDRLVIVTDKVGNISLVDTEATDTIWLKTIDLHKLQDIPYSICCNPAHENSVLIGTMLGGIVQLDLIE